MISVIDLFAGPGGLGEGFEAYEPEKKGSGFKIAVSVECDPWAHKTLELRNLFRLFPKGQAPEEYYSYLRGEISREILFKRYPKEANMAGRIARLGRLGDEESTPSSRVDRWINDALGPKGERKPWTLIGGPPCQAYSLVGRARRSNEARDKFESDVRHTLYREYLRILEQHKPTVFVMENVKGILSARHEGSEIIGRICDDLSAAGYHLHGLSGQRSRDLAGKWIPESFLVRAEEHGIPQTRHRVFIIGVKTGFDGNLGTLRGKETVTVRDAIYDLTKLRSDISSRGTKGGDWITARNKGLAHAGVELDKNTQEVLRGIGGRFVVHTKLPGFELDWFYDPRLRGSVNHESRTHMSDDIARYSFASAFARSHERSPSVVEFPKNLLPKHKNIQDTSVDIPFTDRFRVQLPSKPASTITSHISKDGHYYIHPDHMQARSLTVREAARLQTFPDNYFFEGPRTEQYKQVGNAVPPLLARQIAEIVYKLLQK